MKLWHKLALTFVGLTGIVLILAVILSRQSINTGFLEYLNNIEANRTNKVTYQLKVDYEVNGSWEFLRNDKHLWRQYLRQNLQSPLRRQQRRKMPLRLDQLGERFGEASRQNNRSPEFKRRPPPRGNRPPPQDKMITLLDKDQKLIVGSKNQSSSASLIPIMIDENTIGYLRIKAFTKITDQLDQQFLRYQNNAFTKIAFIALGIILIGAWVLASYLRKRIERIGQQADHLMAGNFKARNIHVSTDELGQLEAQLNHLGETLEKNRTSRQRWISDISHELRTPVAILRGECEALLDGVRELTPESVESLQQEVLRLNRLVDDLHVLSLSDMGALSYDKEKLDINALINNVLKHHTEQFEDKNITVNLHNKNERLFIQGDEQRLTQLFSNLANNSLHYTRDSGVLEVTVTHSNNKVHINWSDSEPGVTDKELSQLFERLYRVESSRNRNTGGSGLGLSICQKIVEAHEGEMVAKHSHLGGISFVMTFDDC